MKPVRAVALLFFSLLVSCSSSVVQLKSNTLNAAVVKGTYAGEYGFSVIDHETSQESLRTLGKLTLTLDSQMQDPCEGEVKGHLQVENYASLEIASGVVRCQEGTPQDAVYHLEVHARNEKNIYHLQAQVRAGHIEKGRMKIYYTDPEIDIIRDFGIKVASLP